MQKNSFEKFARIFNRRHKQTAFSDAVFLGTLRVKGTEFAPSGRTLFPFRTDPFSDPREQTEEGRQSNSDRVASHDPVSTPLKTHLVVCVY